MRPREQAMYYASIGIIALLIHVIINYDVLVKTKTKDLTSSQKAYKVFLHGVEAYYVVDIFWEVFFNLQILPLIFIETSIYFVVMGFSVLLWTKYVTVYINEKSRFMTIFKYGGQFFFISQVVILILNFFWPIAFWLTPDGSYHTGTARSVNLGFQFILFLATSIRMLFVTLKIHNQAKQRHLAIAFFGIAMDLFVVLQSLYPLMPFYSIGYMLGTCLIHTFVLEDEKEARRMELAKLRLVERIQEAELGSARQMAYQDPLTEVKNKNAYMEDIIGIERRLEDRLLDYFALVVFDVNGLKDINDTKGHAEGDKYIKSGAMLISSIFRNSPIYRIGGDEFVAFLKCEDYKNKEKLIEEFNSQVERNLKEGKVVVSCGYAEFNPQTDKKYQNIFERADKNMYERKKELKEKL
ncbi:GGDEF domain-containing protein [Treponema ruminis]|nr:GGDEF domain-containing protein [Treponema ruminis]